MITLSSDFAVQSQGCGVMEAVIHDISPDERVIHLMHGLPAFNIMEAAWALESVASIEIGHHVCVVDPGVGTKRKGIIIHTKRGDNLIGPDNGVLIPATRLLGGIVKVVSIENTELMRTPVSPIFHGRDVFSPAAAYLSKEVPIENFGPKIDPEELYKAPYEEAVVIDNMISAKIIHINKFGTIHLNIFQDEFDKLGVVDTVMMDLGDTHFRIPYRKTFGDVEKGSIVLLKDDYARIEIAVNKGNFVKRFKLMLGQDVVLRKA